MLVRNAEGVFSEEEVARLKCLKENEAKLLSDKEID